MSREEEQLPDLTAFESALAALAPRVGRFDREQLIFQAGQAAALRDVLGRSPRWARWGWPAAFSAVTAVAAVLGMMLWARGPECRASGCGAGGDGIGRDNRRRSAAAALSPVARPIIESTASGGSQRHAASGID